VRYGRYTLAELAPDSAQQDLMLQVIDVTVPATLTATVGDALRYVLLRSGYQLCESNGPFESLEALPLPAAHLHLGPLKLHDALQVLAGSAWQLEVNQAARRVCFTQRADAVSTSAQPDPGAAVTHALPAAVTPNSLATERQQ
jgi:type IV pili sensor histidine kinase/response regulator